MTQRRTKNQHWKHFLCEEEPSLSNLSRLHSIQTLNVPLSCIKYSQDVWYCQLCLVKQILVFLVLLFKSKQLIRLACQGDNEGIMALHARLPWDFTGRSHEKTGGETLKGSCDFNSSFRILFCNILSPKRKLNIEYATQEVRHCLVRQENELSCPWNVSECIFPPFLLTQICCPFFFFTEYLRSCLLLKTKVHAHTVVNLRRLFWWRIRLFAASTSSSFHLQAKELYFHLILHTRFSHRHETNLLLLTYKRLSFQLHSKKICNVFPGTLKPKTFSVFAFKTWMFLCLPRQSLSAWIRRILQLSKKVQKRNRPDFSLFPSSIFSSVIYFHFYSRIVYHDSCDLLSWIFFANKYVSFLRKEQSRECLLWACKFCRKSENEEVGDASWSSRQGILHG